MIAATATVLAAVSAVAGTPQSGNAVAVGNFDSSQPKAKSQSHKHEHKEDSMFSSVNAHLYADSTYGSDGHPKAGIHRVNNCKYPAWFASVVAGDADPIPYALRSGHTVYSPYTVGPGVSEKYADQEFELLTPDLPVVQLEYKLGGDDRADTMFYDLSFIDCGEDSSSAKGACAFVDGGYLISFDEGGDSDDCPNIYCPHHDDPNQKCRSAYYQPDDRETFVCVREADFWNKVNMTITFCPSDESIAEFTTTLASDDAGPIDAAQNASSKHSNT